MKTAICIKNLPHCKTPSLYAADGNNQGVKIENSPPARDRRREFTSGRAESLRQRLAEPGLMGEHRLFESTSVSINLDFHEWAREDDLIIPHAQDLSSACNSLLSTPSSR